MIGKIKGKLLEIDGNLGLIETAGGLSYYVYLTNSLLLTFHPLSSIELYTYFHVKEDKQSLYGFENKKQQQFFKMLLKVPGVGPKTAFTVISFAAVDELIEAVKKNNVDFFTNIPGLGRKTSTKIILELSSILKSEFETKNLYLSEEDKIVIDALTSLGFKAYEARKVLGKIPRDLKVEERIKEALKQIK